MWGLRSDPSCSEKNCNSLNGFYSRSFPVNFDEFSKQVYQETPLQMTASRAGVAEVDGSI